MTCDRCASNPATRPIDGATIRDNGGERRPFMACDGCGVDFDYGTALLDRVPVRRLAKTGQMALWKVA